MLTPRHACVASLRFSPWLVAACAAGPAWTDAERNELAALQHTVLTQLAAGDGDARPRMLADGSHEVVLAQRGHEVHRRVLPLR